MMKIQFIQCMTTLMLLCGIAQTSTSHAASNQLAKINLELSVDIVAFSCGISVDQNNKTVELGNWTSQFFKKKGDVTSEKIIQYNVSNCPAIPSVNFSFSGPKDGVEPELLAIESGTLAAKNVAIELLDSGKNRLALGKPSPKILLDNNGNGTATFYARYVATSLQPQAGHANATATFNIQYD